MSGCHLSQPQKKKRQQNSRRSSRRSIPRQSRPTPRADHPSWAGARTCRGRKGEKNRARLNEPRRAVTKICQLTKSARNRRSGATPDTRTRVHRPRPCRRPRSTGPPDPPRRRPGSTRRDSRPCRSWRRKLGCRLVRSYRWVVFEMMGAIGGAIGFESKKRDELRTSVGNRNRANSRAGSHFFPGILPVRPLGRSVAQRAAVAVKIALALATLSWNLR